MNRTFYITTPIYYPNADLHMGHAYSSVLTDVLARYHRGLDENVYFLTGDDEHASKVAKAAIVIGKSPKDFVDEKAKNFKEFYKKLDISYSYFIQTTDKEKHWPGAVEMWKRLTVAGDIYKKKYSGLYCQGCESFVTEKDLVSGLCPFHNAKPEYLEEENYFFKLSKYTDKIKEIIESDNLKIVPESRKNEILSLLNEGLEDISFSRPIGEPIWGIPVPDDPSQVMYVWCDALTNYISALGFGGKDDSFFKKYWPANLHVVGKDILRFHAAVWPAMLLSAGIPLPKAILAHGFITSGGKKMSKTVGNVIDPQKLIDEYGADAVRYYLIREVNPFEDGDITEEKFREAYNGNLANGLGNLTSRVVKMAEMYGVENTTSFDGEDSREEYKKAMDGLEVNKAADVVWKIIGGMDKRIQETEPFKLFKTDPESAKKIVSELLARLSLVAELLSFLIPETSQKIKEAIAVRKMPAPLFVRK